MSRLARSNKDWHQLLEVCAVFDTLLADQDGVYDPRDYNDRLLLGLKGAISEAELHLLRKRMHEGLLNKARRGEVYNHPPIGYVKSPDGDFVLDPDEQARAVVRLVFELFDRLGTAHAVLRYLAGNGIRLPVRPIHGQQRGQLQWHRPNRVTVHGILEHPIYAGYYRWGYRTVDPRRKVAGRPNSGRTKRKPGECPVLLPGHCPAYITAERFWSNQERLQANRCGHGTPGAPRGGPSLLGGVLFCGRCGYRMQVNYGNNGSGLRYVCARAHIAYGEPECQALAGGRLDALVGAQVLAALRPAALELHLAAAADVEEQRRQLHQQWRLRLERADYEVERAARQYHQVEPEHRLVRTVGSYRQLADYPRLCARLAELRAEGQSLEEVARRLNEEGFHPPKQVDRFTGGMVWGMLTRQCEGASRSRAEEVAGCLEEGEWLLGDLARFLGMPQTTLHRWRKAGWVLARKLTVSGGLWAIQASGPERRRMEKLRRFQKEKPNQPIPAKLTTPELPKQE
jgi:Recombinase/Resolvase, N terminal domain/Recombinase zinc beta ribbon domain